jgi:5-hydroxyisourate hydrolase
MSTITSHVLDTASGKPAGGLAVKLERSDGQDRWAELGQAVTDASGRISGFDPPLASLARQTYRLRFATGAYFAATCVRTFYPEVHVVVEIDDPSQHYHIPLLLSPFGYSTYRGS